MTIASKLGKYAGIIAAESLWLSEMGFKTGIAYYAANISLEKLVEISEQHAINSDDPETVTENIFDCLEFID